MLVRYLRQRAEFGEQEVILASNASEVLARLRDTTTDTMPPGAMWPALGTHPPGDRATSQLGTLAGEAAACLRCRLHETRQRVVFGEGNPTAQVVVVGEAPGAEEDRSGRPFVGLAGKLLDLLLLSAGWPRESVYICNVLKCRPPENRNPAPDEVASCAAFLRGQLEAIAPSGLLALGNFAARNLMKTDEGIGRLRGKVHSYEGIPLVATYHPAFLLRSRRWIPAAWDDLQLLRRALNADG